MEEVYGEGQEIFLQMELQKGNFQTDEDGNFLFDVEASNENLDLEGQRVLQRALLTSKEYFLSNGVISKDHLHKKTENGKWVNDEEFVIGEPVSVYTDGKSTRVKGKLYQRNPHAKKFIELLESGSSRVKASVGGILPKVVKNLKDNTEKVVSFLWNDLALTIAPVNYTVQGATGILAKSLSSYDFVKALTAGYGTDSSQYTGGRALQKEDVGSADMTQENDDYEVAISKLITAISKGKVNTLEEAQDYLGGLGITNLSSLATVKEIIEHSKELMEVLPMAKKGSLFESIIGNIRKSMSGSGISKGNAQEPESEPKEEPKEELEEENEGDEEELVDAGEVIKALTDRVEALAQGQEELAKAIRELAEMNKNDAEFKKSIGEGLIALMENTEKIAGSPAPRRGATNLNEAGIQKGNLGNEGGSLRRHRRLTKNDRDELAPVITKAVEAGELDIIDAGKLETQINKSINDPNFQIEPRLLAFLEKKLPKPAAA
jgi:hypothetical protein